MPIGLWKLLHLFFAFSYVGSLVVAEWNGRAARATQDWSVRALLHRIVYLSTRVAGLGPLFLVGVFGNVLAVSLGYRMAASWLMCVNGVWLAAMLGMALLTLPNARLLAELSNQATTGSPPERYPQALARWRFGNVVQSVLYLTLLALMVFRWRS